MSKGFQISQSAHVVPLVVPANGTGGVTGAAFNMKNHAHASIIVQLGAQAAQATKILVNQCTAQNGAGAVAIPFDLYACETTNTDVLGVRQAVAATGYTPTATPNTFYVIELDAAQLAQGSNFVQLQITNGANADFFSAVAILSGARFANDQSATALA